MEKLRSCFGDKMLDTRLRIVSLKGGICPGLKLNTGVENKGIRICKDLKKIEVNLDLGTGCPNKIRKIREILFTPFNLTNFLTEKKIQNSNFAKNTKNL